MLEMDGAFSAKPKEEENRKTIKKSEERGGEGIGERETLSGEAI